MNLVTWILQVFICQGFSMKLIRDNEEGSGCPGRRHYFDYIDVDDEDYVDGSGLGLIQEYVSEGPPVIEDSQEDLSGGDLEGYFRTLKPTTPQPMNIVPEQLVLTNETHGSLDGRYIVPNNDWGSEQDIIVIEADDDGKPTTLSDVRIDFVDVEKVMQPAMSRSCVIKMNSLTFLCSLMKFNL